MAAAITRVDCGSDITRLSSRLRRYVEDGKENFVTEANDLAQTGLAERDVDTAERMFLTNGKWHITWKCASYAKENSTDGLVRVYGWVALRNAFQWANQNVHQPNETAELICIVVFRRAKNEATRHWVMNGTGQQQMKLANYVNRKFVDHISRPLRGMVREVRNGFGHCHRGRLPAWASFQCHCHLNDDIEWSRRATLNGAGLWEWRLMGHIMVMAMAVDWSMTAPGMSCLRMKIMGMHPATGCNDRPFSATAIAQVVTEIVLRMNGRGMK
ncbi:unnamed protein product [Symbiodinium sp. CCMP2456]|nr:unnamed protein product [Symbiodinium sp. CCMP2456]